MRQQNIQPLTSQNQKSIMRCESPTSHATAGEVFRGHRIDHRRLPNPCCTPTAGDDTSECYLTPSTIGGCLTPRSMDDVCADFRIPSSTEYESRRQGGHHANVQVALLSTLTSVSCSLHVIDSRVARLQKLMDTTIASSHRVPVVATAQSPTSVGCYMRTEKSPARTARFCVSSLPSALRRALSGMVATIVRLKGISVATLVIFAMVLLQLLTARKYSLF